MAEYKAKLLKNGGVGKASNIYLADGSTTVEAALEGVELYNEAFTSANAFVALAGMTISNLANCKTIEVKVYWASDASMISLFLDVTNNAFTQVWVTPQVVEAGTTYRFLIEAKFENNQLYVRANITGYTFTPTRAKVYAQYFKH